MQRRVRRQHIVAVVRLFFECCLASDVAIKMQIIINCVAEKRSLSGILHPSCVGVFTTANPCASRRVEREQLFHH